MNIALSFFVHTTNDKYCELQIIKMVSFVDLTNDKHNQMGIVCLYFILH